jgi:3-oxoacyl-[acyl-carrier-protein] synthase III
MSLKRAKITGVGRYLPEYVLTNAELETLVDTNDEWIKSRTGISERRILKDPEKASAFMAENAAKEALEDAGIDAADLDAVIVATVTPDYIFPATAALVQKRIGAEMRMHLTFLQPVPDFSSHSQREE